MRVGKKSVRVIRDNSVKLTQKGKIFKSKRRLRVSENLQYSKNF